MKATIVLLTFNAKPWVKELVEGALNQKTDFDYEILAIDSGSKDGTVEILKEYDEKDKRVRLHQIPNSEFGHGKTRNYAAKMAKGEFVVYLTHDAVPAADYWLTEMLKPFDINPKVAAVYGKQIPRADCCPTVKADVINTFAGFGPDHYVMLQMADPNITFPPSLDAITFFSDVNSAVRKSVLLGDVPYRDINYSEDMAFGRDVINAGLMKAYAPLGAVIHSHSYPPMKYLRRMYDEMNGLKKATGVTLDTSIAFHLAWITRQTLRDWRFILRDRSYNPLVKIKYIFQAPVYNSFRRIAIRLSTKETIPPWAHSLLSLEHRARKKA